MNRYTVLGNSHLYTSYNKLVVVMHNHTLTIMCPITWVRGIIHTVSSTCRLHLRAQYSAFRHCSSANHSSVTSVTDILLLHQDASGLDVTPAALHCRWWSLLLPLLSLLEIAWLTASLTHSVVLIFKLPCSHSFLSVSVDPTPVWAVCSKHPCTNGGSSHRPGTPIVTSLFHMLCPAVSFHACPFCLPQGLMAHRGELPHHHVGRTEQKCYKIQ